MQKLFEKIREISSKKTRPVIFICGLGGSGKTTLAHEIEKDYKTIVIETDWYLAHATEKRKKGIADALATKDTSLIERTENPLHWYSWDAFAADVRSLQENGKLHIPHAWNQKTGEKDLSIDLQFEGQEGLILCDGIYLLHPPLIDLADLVVLLEVPKEVSQERAQQRDAHRSSPDYLAYKASLVQKYDLPYFEKYRSNADMVIGSA